MTGYFLKNYAELLLIPNYNAKYYEYKIAVCNADLEKKIWKVNKTDKKGSNGGGR